VRVKIDGIDSIDTILHIVYIAISILYVVCWRSKVLKKAEMLAEGLFYVMVAKRRGG